ncbi:Protachykinin-1 [Dissostichus eleginoides]|uniref:Protachykinin-1 n=1 Tax=Dissostichus eleginoides TaxID=100907 RepID=A0AAD9B8H4_DISEL|nr:Protachykinin-1 [Dissostichus eleginoides]
MEALKLAGVLLVVVWVQVFGALGTPLKQRRRRRRGVEGGGLAAQQFHGLMGRSTGDSQHVRVGKKRNKGEMFVGLMGRRSLGGDTEEDWTPDSY